MNIVKRKLSELKPPEKNIRMHPPKQIKEYVRSLKKNGQLKLMVIDENNVIWIGNGLFLAMKECGYEEADCILKEGMTEADKKKMMLSDNRIFDLGVDDMSVFDELIAELSGDLDVPGFDEEMLKTFVMNDDDVDDLMNDYGVIAPEKAEEIRETAQKYEEPQGKYIICPGCGRRIWL